MDKLLEGGFDSDSNTNDRCSSSRHATTVDDNVVNLLKDIDDSNDLELVIFKME